VRYRRGTSIAAFAVVAALALATPAAAQQAPTLGAPPTPDVTVQTQSTSTTGGGGLKTWQEALIFAAGILLVGGIAVAILTDARERAGRLRRGDPATEPSGPPHRHRQQSKQRARAKGKAARVQRRKNR
jgi:hypothetical protein